MPKTGNAVATDQTKVTIVIKTIFLLFAMWCKQPKGLSENLKVIYKVIFITVILKTDFSDAAAKMLRHYVRVRALHGRVEEANDEVDEIC